MLEVFKHLISHKEDYLTAETGGQFEDRFEQNLRRIGYSRILRRDFDSGEFKRLKEFVVQKEKNDFLKIDGHNKSFIRGPFGSQNYPDFIVFSDNYAIPVEIKYSKKKQKRPIWNSGIPRANGIYIFGSYGQQDITFFVGKDILNQKRRGSLIAFFEEIKNKERAFKRFAKESLPDKEKRGFMPYVRRAYEQKRINEHTELDYFTHSKRAGTEKSVLKLLENL